MSHDDEMTALALVSATVLTCAVGLLLALGWTLSQKSVSSECQRLGAFYVGDKTFECKEKK